MVKSNSIHRRIKRLSIQDYEQSCRLIKLRSLHAEVDWRIKEQRREFLRRLYPLIDDWQGQFPNLRDIFRPEQIDQLLAESVDHEIEPTPLYDFVLRCGYEDVAPRLGEELHIDGNDRLLRRATALHRAARCWCPADQQRKERVRELFQIYNRFEVHHWDERSGWTHFHVALWFGLYDLVAIIRVLHPVDPRLNGDPPLHWALRQENRARLAEWLLRRGADPNEANARGETPLHLICERDRPDDDGLAGLFFALCDVRNREVRVDARHNQGRTPLQSAVASLGPNNVDVLLARGADLAKFRFPSEDYFAERLSRLTNEDDVVEKLRVATGILRPASNDSSIENTSWT